MRTLVSGSRLATLLIALALLGAVSVAQVQIFEAAGDSSDQFAGGQMLFNLNGGPAVALSRDVLVVGVTYDDLPGQGNQGSAIVFRWNGATWVEEQKLISSVGDTNDSFGWSVDICGDVIVVGAPFDDVGGVIEDGSATVFRWNGTSFVEEQTLVVGGDETYDGFGWSVAVNGDVIVVGSMLDDVGAAIDRGSATVFRWNGTLWVEEQTLLAGSGVAFDNFGCSVSASGLTIAVGAYLADPGGVQDAGSVTVYRWNGLFWDEEETLAPALGAVSDNFGNAVSVSGDVIVGGAHNAEVGAFFAAGSATVFRWNGASWVEQQTLTANAPASFDNFGAALSANGHSIVVGSIFDDVGTDNNEGSATLFRWDGTTWNAEPTLTAAVGIAHDHFGATVAVDGDTVVAGAPGRDIASKGAQGVAYVFDLPASPWSNRGSALAGVFGDPLFVGAGPLSPGSMNVVSLSDAASSAPSGGFLGFAEASIPFKGGIIKPLPFLMPIQLTTSPSGTFSIPFLMPGGLPSGTTLWLQWAILDPAAINGFSLSNAIRGTTP